MLSRRNGGHQRTIKRGRRIRILLRDHQRCRYCGVELDPFARWPSPRYLTLDHVIPFGRGGDNTAGNVVVACEWCNQRKGSRTPAEAGMRLLPAPGVFRYWSERKQEVVVVEETI